VPQASKVTLPWVLAEHAATAEIMNGEVWPYELAANRTVIEAMIRRSQNDGLLALTLSADELFVTELLDTQIPFWWPNVGFFRLEGLGAAGFVYLADVSKSPSADKSSEPFEPRPLTQDWRSGLRPGRKRRRLYRPFISVM
jgi:hypothetical protein